MLRETSHCENVDPLVLRAEAAWPELAVDRSVFQVSLRRALQSGLTPTSIEVEDLYLSTACGIGIPAAFAVFERLYLRDLVSALAAVDSHPEFISEGLQQLRIRLFTDDEHGE